MTFTKVTFICPHLILVVNKVQPKKSCNKICLSGRHFRGLTNPDVKLTEKECINCIMSTSTNDCHMIEVKRIKCVSGVVCVPHAHLIK